MHHCVWEPALGEQAHEVPVVVVVVVLLAPCWAVHAERQEAMILLLHSSVSVESEAYSGTCLVVARVEGQRMELASRPCQYADLLRVFVFQFSVVAYHH